MKCVAIAGGGASGMAAALTAAEDTDNRVILFERQARVGRKLLSTGNGRCNLTNTGASVRNYCGEDPEFILPAMGRFSPESNLQFFRDLGLVCTEQYGGRVFPLSDSAGSVLDVLRFSLESRNVEIHTAEPIQRAYHSGKGFQIFTEQKDYSADCFIVACGGKAGGKLGGVGDGYDLLRAFGHRCTKLHPSLVPIFTDTDFPRSLKGIRADASVKLFHGKTLSASGAGELQFVEKGISGPAAFDISRCASVNGGRIEIDFLREMTAEEAEKLILLRREISPELETLNIFAGILQSRLGLAIVKYAGLRPSGRIRDVSDADIHRLAVSAKHFSMNVTGTDTFDNAQVTAGGIVTSEFSPETMESRLVRNLYACGEVLDIDGACGGYNLQWAWASGRLAGRLGK